MTNIKTGIHIKVKPGEPVSPEVVEKIKGYETGAVTLDELEQFMRARDDLVVATWDLTTDRNPLYPIDNNKTRASPTYHPKLHPKGRFWQNVLKRSVIHTILFVHAGVIKHYDKDAFVYDDPRLNALSDFLHAFVDIHFPDRHTQSFMPKLIDSILHLMKEDIRYGARGFLLINQLCKNLSPTGFELTEVEKKNIKMWSKEET
jgi:hypothetical protein